MVQFRVNLAGASLARQPLLLSGGVADQVVFTLDDFNVTGAVAAESRVVGGQGATALAAMAVN